MSTPLSCLLLIVFIAPIFKLVWLLVLICLILFASAFLAARYYLPFYFISFKL